MLKDFPLADFFSSPAIKEGITGSILRCHESVRERLDIQIQGVPGQRRDYLIEVLHPEFIGNLKIFLGPGTGKILIESRGLIAATIRMFNESSLSIHANTAVTATFIIGHADVVLGEDNLWENEVLVQANDQHGIVDLQTNRMLNAHRRKIVFGKHVWVRRRAMILPDTLVGDGSVIDMSAVLAARIPACSIASGNPAVVVRQGVSWSRAPGGFNEEEQAFVTAQPRFVAPVSEMAASPERKTLLGKLFGK